MQIIKHKTNIDFIGKRRPALFISSVLNLAILVGITIFGFERRLDPDEVKKTIETSGTGIKEVRLLGEAQGGGTDYQAVASGMADRVFSAMKKGLDKTDFLVQRVDYVGPQVGKQLRNK